MPPLARLAPLLLVIALVLAAFTWPSGRLEPRNLPVGVVGPVPAALSDADAFDVHRYASPAEARDAVADRDVYGAVAGRTLLVATGASPAVASSLVQAAPGATVRDVAPGTDRDPRAATLGALALPLTLLGIVAALVATFLARRTRERVATVLGVAVVTGLLAALLTQTWLDALPGSWLGLAGAVALAVTAIGAAVAGLAAHLGRAGIGVGAALMMLVANPWSGIATAPELLPEPAGAIGQLLPTGAAGSLLRSVAFFDGAGAGAELAVLGAWALAGFALLATAGLRRREPAEARVAVAAG